MTEINNTKLSILNCHWSQKATCERTKLAIQQKFALSEIEAHILLARNIELEQVANYIEPKLKNLLQDPFHLKDMAEAIGRIIEAISKKQKICIYGDYDVDGATSSALFKRFFRDIGIEVDIYIPDRIEEGYGLNNEAIKYLASQNYELIITVDCGTSSLQEIDYANSLNLDVIIIDHHLSGDELPKAVAVINPNRLDETSPYRYLAAVGVSYLTIIALTSKLREADYFKELKAPNLLNYLDIVALGTVCDVMELKDLNRCLVKQGLRIINNHQNCGLNALIEISGIDEEISCYHLGFMLGPRINAGGRVGQADLGSKLLATTCNNQAMRIATELNHFNNQRKLIEEQVIIEATAIAETQVDNNIIFAAGENWHPGVIGIAAGRLKEKYNKPVAVISIEDDLAKASCRSIKQLDFGALIIEAKNKNLLVAGGGHAMAAGFTVETNKLKDLEKFFNSKINELFKDQEILHQQYYDSKISIKAADLQLIKNFNRFAPFGVSNPEPVFAIENLYILQAKIVGSKHISCLLAADKTTVRGKALKAIAFNATDNELGKILLNQFPFKLKVIMQLKINKWNNNENPQAIIKDLIILD